MLPNNWTDILIIIKVSQSWKAEAWNWINSLKIILIAASKGLLNGGLCTEIIRIVEGRSLMKSQARTKIVPIEKGGGPINSQVKYEKYREEVVAWSDLWPETKFDREDKASCN